MKGTINEFVATACSISPCVGRKMRRNCFVINSMGYFENFVPYSYAFAVLLMTGVVAYRSSRPRRLQSCRADDGQRSL